MEKIFSYTNPTIASNKFAKKTSSFCASVLLPAGIISSVFGGGFMFLTETFFSKVWGPPLLNFGLPALTLGITSLGINLWLNSSVNNE